MSGLAALTALVQSLVVTVESQATDMQKVHSALDNLNIILIADSDDSADTEIQFTSVEPCCEDHNRVASSPTLRKLGKDFPHLTEKNSSWKAHMLAHASATGDGGDADITEVFSSSTHPRARTAKDFMWIKEICNCESAR